MPKTDKAIIFDMNGVIVNDERVHQQSWVILFKKYNKNLSEEEFMTEVFGRTEFDTIRFVFGTNLSTSQIEKYCHERDNIVKSIIGSKPPQVPYIQELLAKISSLNIPIGLATGSRSHYVEFVLSTLNLKKYFDNITTADEVIHGKPDPEIYLLTAKKLNVNPTNCIVFEDSISGINSAKSANMKVIAITTTHQRNELLIADKVIDSYADIPVEELINF